MDRKMRSRAVHLPDPINGNEIDPALVDRLEFYHGNYFKKPGLGKQDAVTERGRRAFAKVPAVRLATFLI